MSADVGSDTGDISDAVLTAEERFSDTEVAHLEDLSDTHFPDNEALDANTMKAIQLQESSAGVDLGLDRKPPGGDPAAGPYQIEKDTAERFLGEEIPDTATTRTDPRFDERQAAEIATEYVADLDRTFEEGRTLTEDLDATPIPDTAERKKATLAAYNMGEGNVAQAQERAAEEGDDPTAFSDVQERFDEAAGQEKAEEARNYVDDVTSNEREFRELDERRDRRDGDDLPDPADDDESDVEPITPEPSRPPDDPGSGGQDGSGGSLCPTPPKPGCRRYETRQVFVGWRFTYYPPFVVPEFEQVRVCVE